MKYPEISKELIEMRAADQELRTQWRDRHNDPQWVELVKETDCVNTARLKEIVERYGWPTISMVGEQGSEAAWLLVQHADHDLEFQLRCLALMKASGDVNPLNVAYLTDRTLVAQGKPQIYGTQFYRPNGEGKHIPQPIKDSDKVDDRRAELGMSSLKEYAAVINRE